MHKTKTKAKMCQEIQVKTSQIKAWGDPSSKAEFQSSKTLWRSKQTPVLELPKPGQTLLSPLTGKAAQKWAGTAEEWNCGMQEQGSNTPRAEEVVPTVKPARTGWEQQFRSPGRQLESHQHSPPNLLLPWQGAVPQWFLCQSLTAGIAAPGMPPRALFPNKVTLMQGKYKYVLWPFCIVPPKRAQKFLFHLIVQNQL